MPQWTSRIAFVAASASRSSTTRSSVPSFARTIAAVAGRIVEARRRHRAGAAARAMVARPAPPASRRAAAARRRRGRARRRRSHRAARIAACAAWPVPRGSFWSTHSTPGRCASQRDQLLLLVAGDDDRARRRERRDRLEDVLQRRDAADLGQHLRSVESEPLALPAREDHHRERTGRRRRIGRLRGNGAAPTPSTRAGRVGSESAACPTEKGRRVVPAAPGSGQCAGVGAGIRRRI